MGYTRGEAGLMLTVDFSKRNFLKAAAMLAAGSLMASLRQ